MYNQSVREWESEFAQKLAQYNDSLRLQAQELSGETLADAGDALLKAGILPGDEQLAALGLSREQAQAYLTAQQVTGGGSGSNWGDWRHELLSAGKVSNTEAVAYLMQRYGLSRLDAQSWVYGKGDDTSYSQWVKEQEKLSGGSGKATVSYKVM